MTGNAWHAAGAIPAQHRGYDDHAPHWLKPETWDAAGADTAAGVQAVLHAMAQWASWAALAPFDLDDREDRRMLGEVIKELHAGVTALLEAIAQPRPGEL